MEKKYQVFISSTFSDLIEERQEVMQALLELDCIPVGMELFPAADDDQWTLIKRLIDDCDYYVLIQAGRYGSIGSGGKSYTQMEYEYALEIELPIISFLHSDPSKIESGRSEKDQESLKKLDEFRSLVQKKMCRYWESVSELGSQVSRSLVKLIKSKPQIGWIKADLVASDEANKEISILRKKILELEMQLNTSSNLDGVLVEEVPFRDEVSTCKRIDIMANTLNRSLSSNSAVLSDFLSSGGKIRIMVMSPDERKLAINMAAERSLESVETYRYKLNTTINQINFIEKEAEEGNVKLRFCSFAPSFGLYIFDKDTVNERMYVRVFAHYTQLDRNPTFKVVKSESPKVYTFFANQFELIWDKSI